MPRNSSGTYTLPAGNPVVTGTTISSTWANSTLSDIGSELTDSLSRSGEGGMLASLGLFSGVIGAPGLSWTAETTSGLYRAGAGDFRYSISATDKLQLITTGLGLPAAGVVATPSLFFIGDPNTGLYPVGADDIGITTGGTLRLDVSTTAITSTLPHRGQDGTAAAPAYSFSSDTDVGIYRSTTNELSFATAGAQAARVNATGNFVFLNASYAPDGVVGTPAWSFTNDTDTGIYRRAANTISFAVAGVLTADIGALGVRSFVAGFTTDVDGTAAAPSYTFTSDQDTGIYRFAADTMIFVAGGSGRAVIATQGLAVLDGSAGSPSLYFNSDTNTGIFRPGADTFRISCGGVSVLSLDTGTVIIGNSAGYILDLQSVGVSGSASAGAATLPANPVGFIVMQVGGTLRKVPYYAT